MPIYEYECVNCDKRTTNERTFEDRKTMAQCPRCGAACEYILSATAGFMKGGPTVPSGKRRTK